MEADPLSLRRFLEEMTAQEATWFPWVERQAGAKPVHEADDRYGGLADWRHGLETETFLGHLQQAVRV